MHQHALRGAGAAHHTTRHGYGHEPELEQLRLRLLNQLDQRTGREKAVLRRTIAALTERLQRRRSAGSAGSAGEPLPRAPAGYSR